MSQSFTAVQTFASGLVLQGASTGTGSLHLDGGIGATDGNKVNLEGASGNTYLMRDTDTGFILVYRDGVLKATITGKGVIPGGACPTDIWSMETGTQCVDSLNRTVVVTATGPVFVSGVTP